MAVMPRYLLVFDGQCEVCGRLVAAVRRWDRAGSLEILPYQDPDVARRFPHVPATAFRDAMQLLGPAGERWEGAAAIERMLEVLPAGRLLGWTFRVPVLGGLLDRGYRWFARNRYRFGCGAHCPTRPG
jgi:predicted DCC family thiol-disulfide oxidoreductase YuxK